MSKDLTKKDPLGGKLNQAKDFYTGQEITVEDNGRDYSKEIEKTRALGIPDVEQVEVINPITKKVSLVTIDRRGTYEEKLAMMLLSPDATQEQKDSMFSLFLFERGKENSSLLMDLYQKTGMQTKEVRAFKSQMRFDYEMFVALITTWMSDMSDEMLEAMKMNDDKPTIINKILKAKGNMDKAYPKLKPLERSVLRMAIGFHEVSYDIMKKTKALTEQREGEKGKGIFVSKSGKVFNILDAEQAFADELKEAREVKKVDKG